MKKIYIYQQVSAKNINEEPFYIDTEVFSSKEKALSKLSKEYNDLMAYYDEDIYEEDYYEYEWRENTIKAHKFKIEERAFNTITELFVIEKEIKG